MGGFECATHRRHDGVRVDVITDTAHDTRASEDYALLARHGMLSARDGLRWHRIETTPGRYDWSSWLPQLRAARETGVEVLWDLMHWGYPNDLDLFAPAFVARFAAFARAAAEVHAEETGVAPWWVPVNEISFWAWIGGTNGTWAPHGEGRGWELKAQCVRAARAAIDACRAVDPRARFAVAEPMIHIHPREDSRAGSDAAFWANDAQFEALDMLLGRRHPDLGGSEDLVDLVGVNYYVNNQWELDGPTVFAGLPHYRPPRDLLANVHARYGRPLFIAETGCEGVFRPAWLRFMCDEVAVARAAGVPVEGLCLYPVLDHPGWDDGRHCPNGLFDGCGDRAAYAPLAAEVAVQRARFDAGRG